MSILHGLGRREEALALAQRAVLALLSYQDAEGLLQAGLAEALIVREVDGWDAMARRWLEISEVAHELREESVIARLDYHIGIYELRHGSARKGWSSLRSAADEFRRVGRTAEAIAAHRAMADVAMHFRRATSPSVVGTPGGVGFRCDTTLLDWVRVALSILSVAGTFASILAIAVVLLRWRLSQSKGPTRIAVAVVFLIMSVVVGIVSLPREPATADEEDAGVATAGTQVQGPAITVIATSGERAMPALEPLPISQASPSSKPSTRSEIVVGERERAMPEVVAAADDALTILRSEFHAVRGNLRGSQTVPDPALAGLITTDLTLDVKLMDRAGIVLDAFTITSRGGGFSADASGLQARERLRDALRKRIGKEHQ